MAVTAGRAAVVAGVGPSQGLGAALARRFAAAGKTVFIVGRTLHRLQQVAEEIEQSGGRAIPVVADATREEDVSALFSVVDRFGFEMDLLTCTVDKNHPESLPETSRELFESLWRANCLAAFLLGREAAFRMRRQGKGTIIFTGASASLRARPPFIAFASAKFALRALAQGMAREFGPEGIHVAHVVIDGVIDGERARRQFPDLVAGKGEEGLIRPESIADLYWQLHCQPPDAWTHELDVRPHKESF